MDKIPQITPEEFSAMVGSLLSLFFAYFPMVKDWFEKLDPQVKPLLNAGILMLGAWIYLILGCDFDWDCVLLNARFALELWFAAIIANQGMFLIGVKQIKKAQKTQAARVQVVQ